MDMANDSILTSTATAGTAAQTAPKVFIVEDDPAVSDSLTQMLSMQGYATASFDSAEAFLAAADATWEGCAILDIRLPGMNGLDLQASLGSRGIKLPVIIITGHGDTKNARAAFKAGAVDFIEKPIDADALLEAVSTSMNAGTQRQHNAAERATLAAKLERLTTRENEVLELIIEASTAAKSPRVWASARALLKSTNRG